MKHIRKFILESKSTAETEFEVLKSLHELGLVDDAELNVYTYIASGSTGDLYLEGTPIAELPAGLRVGGDLDLRDTQIAELPADLSVGRDLWLRGTPIAYQKIVRWISQLRKELGYVPTEKQIADYIKKMFPGVKGNIII